MDEWGGVTIAYRRRLIDSPSYTLNHEEVEKALEEGIAFYQAAAERFSSRHAADPAPARLGGHF